MNRRISNKKEAKIHTKKKKKEEFVSSKIFDILLFSSTHIHFSVIQKNSDFEGKISFSFHHFKIKLFSKREFSIYQLSKKENIFYLFMLKKERKKWKVKIDNSFFIKQVVLMPFRMKKNINWNVIFSTSFLSFSKNTIFVW